MLEICTLLRLFRKYFEQDFCFLLLGTQLVWASLVGKASLLFSHDIIVDHFKADDSCIEPIFNRSTQLYLLSQ